MSEPIRSRKPGVSPTTHAKSGPRPIVRIPGEGTVLPGGRGRAPAKRTRAGLSLRTREVYRRDWSRFANWCKSNRVQPLPCRPETLIRYLDERATQSPRTVLYRELIVICRTHRAEGQRSPRQYPLVRKWLRNYQDDAGLARPAATPIQAPHYKAMVTRLYQLSTSDKTTSGEQRRKLAAIRDRALIVIGRSAKLRRINIRKLTMGDVTVTAAGLELKLRRSRAQGGPTQVILPRVQPVALCPVDAWQAWAKFAGTSPDASAFRLVGTSGVRDKSVAPTDICIAIKRAIHAVGVDPTPYTDESLAAV